MSARTKQFKLARDICLSQNPPGEAFVVVTNWAIGERNWLPLYSLIDTCHFLRPFIEQFLLELELEAWDWFVQFFIDTVLGAPDASPLHKKARIALFSAVWLHGGFDGLLSPIPLPMLFDGRARSCALYPKGTTVDPSEPHIYAASSGALPDKQSAAVIHPGPAINSNAPRYAKWARRNPGRMILIVFMIVFGFALISVAIMHFSVKLARWRGSETATDWIKNIQIKLSK